MNELNFQKLTPTHDVDLSGYEEAFKYIFSQDDIHNIAISGAYGSGKSSVIETFEQKYNEKNFVHISLAHFHPLNAKNIEEEKGSDSKILNEECVIEGKILNQLIQQVNPKKVSQTNFRIKRNVGWIKPAGVTSGVIVFILALLHCLNFSIWKDYVMSFDVDYLSYILDFSAHPGARLISGGIVGLLIGVAIYQIVKIQYSKNILRKVSLKGSEIEIFSEDNDSYFDKYLNEILYILENAGIDALVFEDIDRFENIKVFERLREINTLANKRLTELKKGSQIQEKKRILRFFYLLRDDIFETKDRTKFFDYILPIVPVLDSSNSYDKLKEYLENAGLYSFFEDRFLRGLALYIDDLRILKNIYNEFLIYNKKLNNIELDYNKLFAMITYKNIFPKDFADLQLNKGFVYTVFQGKRDLIEKRVMQIQNELDDISAQINNSRTPEQKETLKSRQARLKQDILKTQNATFSVLLNHDNIDDAFGVGGKEFSAIHDSDYFGLLKYLISRGYIDESYFDYISFFYPNSLSMNDKTFLRSVKDRKERDFGFILDCPQRVVEYLEEFDFTQRATLNFLLSEYILTFDMENYVSAMVHQLENEQRFDYIEAYMRNGHSKCEMVKALNKNWPDMLHLVLSENRLPAELVKEFSYLTIEQAKSEMLEAVNIDQCLTDYISEDKAYLAIDSPNRTYIIGSLKELKVSFEEIEYETADRELFDLIYQANLYTINESNIKLMLQQECGVKDIESVTCKFFTFVLRNNTFPLSSYLLSNVDRTMDVYLGMVKDKVFDESETVVFILNHEDIKAESKRKYIGFLGTKVNDLTEVEEEELQTCLVKFGIVEYTVKNILSYFAKNGLTSELIDFLNSSMTRLDYVKEDDEDFNETFLAACLECQEIDNDKYLQIVANLCKPIDSFDITNLSDDKFDILISQDLVPMNERNLTFIRQKYPHKSLNYIHHDIEKYINVVDQGYFNFDEAIKLIELNDITDEQKLCLLAHTSNSIPLLNHNYSIALTKYILKNNLDKNDIPWLIQKYEQMPQDIKACILVILMDNMRIVIENADDIADGLLQELFRNSNVDFDNKVALLAMTASRMTNEDLKKALCDLDAHKIANKLEGGNQRINATERNCKILAALKEAGVIYGYEKTAKSEYYRLIIKKDKALQRK